MGNRRALLIGIEEYGDDFASLPAVRQDVAFVGKALSACGYEVEKVSSDAKADVLGNTLRLFCETCDKDDVHIIYFSGHGRSVGGKDCLVAAGASRDDVDDLENDYSRVETNLGRFVDRGLVVFFIDACRDGAIAKSGETFGNELVDEPRFIRVFGCRRGERCQVLRKAEKNEAEISIFSKALGGVLLERRHSTLSAVLDRTAESCMDITDKAVLEPQLPRLDYGELTSEKQKILKRRIFDPPVVFSIWEQFNPNHMHCLLIESESETIETPESELRKIVSLTTKGGYGRKVWNAFHKYANDKLLLNGKRREIAESPRDPPIHLATIVVKDAYQEHVFDNVVRALVEADLVIFDVTKFEPGVLLLMGIRSASRRGVSISTHGGGWRELDEIEVPFNLSDLSLNSHTKPKEHKEQGKVADTLVRRIEYGFRQLAKQPRYQDLPAYDALRQLGPLYEAASTIPASTHILMLSSYRVLYEENWLFLSNEIIGCLPSDDWKVLRLVDLGNPQLVSQFLYEQIRRAAACVVDWTEYSPSTFFELGVRLAVSEWGAIQLVDDRYLPEGEQSKRWERMFGQIENMHALFDPFTYRLFGDTSSIRNAIELLLKRSPAMDESHKRDRVYRRVSEAIQDVAETYTPVHKQLIDAADALHHPLQGREGAPQILFRHSRESSSQHAKTESERAAKELRIAAWMYMEYRLKAGYLKRDDPLRQLYEKLGEESASSLFDADEGDLARLILDSLQEKSAETYKPVYKQLIDAADALHHPLQSREGAPRNSGDGSRQLAKIESAKELRIAAWFYMEYRLKPKGELERNESLRKLYEKLGEESANALFDADEVNLAQRILDSLQKQGKQA